MQPYNILRETVGPSRAATMLSWQSVAGGVEETMLLSVQKPAAYASQGLEALGPPKVSPLAVEFSGKTVAVARIHQWLCGHKEDWSHARGEKVCYRTTAAATCKTHFPSTCRH